LRLPIAMRAFYERWLWIMKIFFVEESRLSPRAVNWQKQALALTENRPDLRSRIKNALSGFGRSR
jgi:hypothetical protein